MKSTKTTLSIVRTARRSRTEKSATAMPLGEQDSRPGTDWPALAEGLLQGNADAVSELGRRIERMLSAWQAQDFRDDWEDISQEILLSATLALRDGRIRETAALPGYLRSAARNMFVDRVRQRVQRRDPRVVERMAVEQPSPQKEAIQASALEDQLTVRRLLSHLPAATASLLYKVHGEQRSYSEAAAELGIPLGTAKRRLRDGMKRLREQHDRPHTPGRRAA